jgi:hypothetical protein
MPVPKPQIPELIDVIQKNIDLDTFINLLRDLQSTKAYKSNQSFRITIDRLLEMTSKAAALYN